jgi:hypothetical protein
MDMNIAPHRWSTEDDHFDNNQTMSDYLNHEMDVSWEVQMVDGTYAEVMTDTGIMLGIHAAGDGDSFNHIVTFEEL